MTDLTANIRLRPTRIGFLVRPTDMTSIRKIMRVCTCLWGGLYNPIIPVFRTPPKEWRQEKFERVKGLDVAKGYIRFFEPDVFVEAENGLLEEAGLGALREKYILEKQVVSFDDFLKPRDHRDGRRELTEAYHLYCKQLRNTLYFISMNYEKLTHKKQQLDGYRPLPPELVRNLDDWFTVELTYTSNAIEGNTLTRRETAVVIEKGLTVGGKSLKEHLEATNHAHALDLVRALIKKKPSQLTAKDVLALHDIILKGLDDDNAGHYRSVSVRISGSAVVMPNPRKVPDLMDDFQSWLASTHHVHPVAFAGEAHYRLVTIHPFVDGNGRTARLLMNLLLLMYGYPPAIIRKRDRLAYIAALEKAQLGESKEAYETIIARAVDRSLDIYLKAARGESAIGDVDTDELLKIGELAKVAGETVPTIRYWTKEGLLEVAEVTESGYQLYAADMAQRCKQIKKLKSERFTLEEIKRKLVHEEHHG